MSKHVVIVGATATGPKTASRLKRIDPSIHITMIDESEYISFGACGIPYFISVEAPSLDTLRSTKNGIKRDKQYFEKKDIHVHDKTRATSIDCLNKTVTIEHLYTKKTSLLTYDNLVLATGGKPRIPPIPGYNLQGVTTAARYESASYIHERCASGTVKNIVIIGGGFIAVELAVAIESAWGIKTSIVEFMPQIFPRTLSPDLSGMIQHDLTKNNVDIFTTEKVTHIEGIHNNVTAVHTDKRILKADLVIFAVGFIPNSSLAEAAGLELDPQTKAILVNKYMQTSDPNIYAGGDCVAVFNPITKKPIFLSLGSLANRQGRVIGTNLAGGKSIFSGAVGNWCIQSFTVSAAGTGLTLEQAKNEGFNAFSANIEHFDRAFYFSEKHMLSLELIVDRDTKRILGIQGVSSGGDALKGRIDTVSSMLQFGYPTIDDLSNTEFSYAPPFSTAIDPVNLVANVADNIISKQLNSITTQEFKQLWNNRKKNDIYFADARPAPTAKQLLEKYPEEWHSLPLEDISTHISKLPKNRPIALICNTGLRAYEVLLELKKAGLKKVIHTLGGMQTLIKRGEEHL